MYSVTSEPAPNVPFQGAPPSRSAKSDPSQGSDSFGALVDSNTPPTPRAVIAPPRRTGPLAAAAPTMHPRRPTTGDRANTGPSSNAARQPNAADSDNANSTPHSPSPPVQAPTWHKSTGKGPRKTGAGKSTAKPGIPQLRDRSGCAHAAPDAATMTPARLAVAIAAPVAASDIVAAGIAGHHHRAACDCRSGHRRQHIDRRGVRLTAATQAAPATQPASAPATPGNQPPLQKRPHHYAATPAAATEPVVPAAATHRQQAPADRRSRQPVQSARGKADGDASHPATGSAAVAAATPVAAAEAGGAQDIAQDIGDNAQDRSRHTAERKRDSGQDRHHARRSRAAPNRTPASRPPPQARSHGKQKAARRR